MSDNTSSSEVLSKPVVFIIGRADGPSSLTAEQTQWVLNELNKNKSTKYTSLQDVQLVYRDDQTFPGLVKPTAGDASGKNLVKKRSSWTDEEDKILLEKYKEHGNHWNKIVSYLPGRTPQQLTKRLKNLNNDSTKKKKKSSDDSDSSGKNKDSDESDDGEETPKKKNGKKKSRGRKKKEEPVKEVEEEEEEEEEVNEKRAKAPSKKLKTPLRMCNSCQVEEAAFGSDKTMIQCTNCHLSYHTGCHDPSLDHLRHAYRYDVWKCHDCKPCTKCSKDTDVEQLLICDGCDRSFHLKCIGLETMPDDEEWFCTDCENYSDAPQPIPQVINGNSFFEEDETSVDPYLMENDIDLDHETDAFVDKLRSIYTKKQELLQDEFFVREYIEREGLYTPLELKQQEEAIEVHLSKCTTDEEKERERKTREIFLRGASRDLRTKLVRIRTFHIGVSNQEIKQALNLIKDEEEIIRKLMSKSSHALLHACRKKIAESLSKKKKKVVPPPKPAIEDDEESEYEDEDSDDEFRETKTSVKKRKNKEKKGHHSVPRLLLNDALNAADDMSQWSEARKLAYAKIKTNPNTYYYRFNAPGEAQKNGPFTKEEKTKFLARLKEFNFETNSPQWGIFSMSIPGRVGYQCSNFYRKLLETGELKDDSYQKDSSGKLLGKKNRVENKKKRNKEEGPRKKRRIQNDEDDDDDNDDDEDSDEGGFYSIRESLRGAHNPLAGLADPITGEEVSNPYISKYGHVLSYTTWTKSLMTGKCPFTNQPLSVNDLKRLTIENIEQHRASIKNKLEQLK